MTAPDRLSMPGTGVWSHELRAGDPAEVADAVAELEGLGYTAVWLPQLGPDLLQVVERILSDTRHLIVATGILNIWEHPASEVGVWWHGLRDDQRERMLLGGVGHRQAVGEAWTKPMQTMAAYLDGLDEAGVPATHRCLAAQGPKMLALSRERAAGANPYLVTPEHTRRAREILGPDAILAPEQKVVLESDPARARQFARDNRSIYWGLTNYTDNWKRLGFTDDDVADRSDRLVDALVAWGDARVIAERLAEHRQAGASHVCIRVLQARGQPMPRAVWQQLAAVLC